MGGVRVKGIDDVLYVKGRADFVGFRGNALIRLSYLPLSFSTPVFTPSQYRKQAAKAKQAFRVIYEQMDRADLAQKPLGPAVGAEQEVNGVPYLDPCSVLTEKVFELATGRAPTEAAESESLPVDTAGLREAADELYGQSPEGDVQPPRLLQAQAERPHVAQRRRRPLRPRRGATAGRPGAQPRDRAGG